MPRVLSPPQSVFSSQAALASGLWWGAQNLGPRWFPAQAGRMAATGGRRTGPGDRRVSSGSQGSRRKVALLKASCDQQLPSSVGCLSWAVWLCSSVTPRRWLARRRDSREWQGLCLGS